MRSPWISASSFNCRSSSLTSPQSPDWCRARKKSGVCPLASIASRAPGVAASRPRGNFAGCIAQPSIQKRHEIAVEGNSAPDQFVRPARLAFEQVLERPMIHRHRDDPAILGVEKDEDEWCRNPAGQRLCR